MWGRGQFGKVPHDMDMNGILALSDDGILALSDDDVVEVQL